MAILQLFLAALFLTNPAMKVFEADLLWDAERPLVWADFQGNHEERSPFDALTRGTIKYEYKSISGRNMEIRVLVIFEKSQSWVKPDKKSSYLLKHEQLHFDIYELYARKLIKELRESDILTGEDFGEQIKQLFERMFGEMLEFQQQYDRETGHSNEAKKQAVWEETILEMLDQYGEFQEKVVEFKV